MPIRDTFPPHNKSIGAVFATYNRADLAKQAAVALLQDPELSQLIVVDDGSSDDTIKVLGAIDDPRFTLVTQVQNTGRTDARLTGIKQMTTDIVILLDDDVVAKPGLVKAHLAQHNNSSHPQLLVIGYMPVETNSSTPAISRIYATEYEGAVAEYTTSSAILNKFWGGNVSLAKEPLIRFSEQLSSDLSFHEDQQLGRLAKDAGFEAVFDKTARAAHMHGRSTEGFVKDAINRGHACAEAGQLPSSVERIIGNKTLVKLAQLAAKPIIETNNGLSIRVAKALRRCAVAQGLIEKQQ